MAQLYIVVSQLKTLIERAILLLSKKEELSHAAYSAWENKARSLLLEAFDEDQFPNDFWPELPPVVNRHISDGEQRSRDIRSLQHQLDYLRELVAGEEAAPPSERARKDTLDLFICHSAKDHAVAEAVTDLFVCALRIEPRRIRCTSVDGYRLDGGADFENTLRDEVLGSTLFIALVTPNIVDSTFAHFEMGTRWGSRRSIIPLIACGTTKDELDRPLSSFHVVDAVQASQLTDLLEFAGKNLMRTLVSPAYPP